MAKSKSTNRKVEFLEDVRLADGPYETGDISGFPDDEAQQYIDAGWAKCCKSGESGERVEGSKPMKPLQIHDTEQAGT